MNLCKNVCVVGPSQEQETQNQILKQLEEPSHSVSAISVNGGYMVNSNVDDYGTVKQLKDFW